MASANKANPCPIEEGEPVHLPMLGWKFRQQGKGKPTYITCRKTNPYYKQAVLPWFEEGEYRFCRANCWELLTVSAVLKARKLGVLMPHDMEELHISEAVFAARREANREWLREAALKEEREMSREVRRAEPA